VLLRHHRLDPFGQQRARSCCARVGARFGEIKVLFMLQRLAGRPIGNPVLLILVEVNHTLDRRDDNAETTRYPDSLAEPKPRQERD
jgi:hypothetical protein